MNDLPVTSGLLKITKYLSVHELGLLDYAKKIVSLSLGRAISEIVLSDTRERVVRSLGILTYPDMETTVLEAGALVLLLLPQEANVGEYVSCLRMPPRSKTGSNYILPVFTGKDPELYDTLTFAPVRFGTSDAEVEAWKRVA
jgi:hypothetical protein